MQLDEKKVNKFLYATEGVGAVFVAVFLAAYLGGLPSTNVLHSELAFRIPLIVFGAALLVLILVTVILAAYLRKREN
jgi:Zn-dependent protease with chaperone function